MKIRLAVLDNDINYLRRIVAALGAKYPDSVEVYSFTDPNIAAETLKTVKTDVFLASENVPFDFSLLPATCGFALLVSAPDIESVNDCRAVCKYQRVDLIYQSVLDLYSEKAPAFVERKLHGSCSLVIFSSPCGGCGTSTMAAAYARSCARRGKKTLYLNLEKFGASDLFFSGPGQNTISNLIFALKSPKSLLGVKIESTVRQDPSGVCFFAKAANALDMAELNAADITRLFKELISGSAFDCIVADMDFTLDRSYREVFLLADRIVWVGDGSAISNSKIERAYAALTVSGNETDEPLLSGLCLLYNKFSSKTSTEVACTELPNIGGAPKYEHALTAQILERLESLEAFGRLG